MVRQIHDRYLVLAIALLSLTAAQLGCTRKADTKVSVQMQIAPKATSKNEAMTITGQLEFVIINVHASNGLKVKEFDFNDSTPPPAAQGLSVEVPDVGRGSVLVQVLCVYSDEATATRWFAYGDASVSASGGDLPVPVTVNEIGSSSKEGRLAGRYIDSAAGTGPTGTLVMQYRPPTNPTPMSIERIPMVDGWFSLFMLEGAPMDFRMLETGELIFSQLHVSGSDLKIGGSVVATGTHLAQFSKPRSYRKDGGSVRAMPPEEVFIGYLQKSGLSVVSGKKVCVPSGISEAIPGIFSSTSFASPIDFKSSGGGASDMRYVGGGELTDPGDLYTGLGCTGSAADSLRVFHTLIAMDSDNANGLSAPFKSVAPFRRWDHYINSEVSVTGGNLNLILNWDYLPALTAVEGTTVLAKYVGSGGGDGGHDLTCDELTASEGYTAVADVAYPTKSYTFSGLSGNNVDSSDYWGWQFALCAYRTVSGQKKWVGKYVSGGRAFGDTDQFHSGWAPASAVAVGSTSFNTGAAQHKVHGIDSTSSLYTDVTLDSSTTLTAGDEVLFFVTGSKGSTPCGSYFGYDISPGNFAFSRVLSSSGSSIKVVKGGLIDKLDTTNLTATEGTTPFCYVQAVQVKHYRTLDLSGTSLMTPVSNFGYGTSYGGLIAVRVNGTMALGSTSIHASGWGFSGGASANYHGAGTQGPTDASVTSYTGGTGSSGGGGGGGGFGTGGNGGGGAAGGSASNTNGGWWRLMLGGGGAAGTTWSGGAGGGGIFIIARETTVTGTSAVSADGADGLGSLGGGGGGGSVIFLTKKISGAGTLALAARGGSGGASSGGVGGGGSIYALTCDQSGLSSAVTAIASQGAVGSSAGAGSGSAQILTPSSQYQCQSSE